jgi:hypothetical protein
MSTWKIGIGAAVLAFAMTPPAFADDYSKLTLLTFSGPVDVPGITLPAGTYRFSLADPESGRRVVRVADKDGTHTLGMFISIPNQRMKPTDKPVVMFKEAAAGSPQAIQAWFYPGETYGYEFAYPHDQALKIAKATHKPILSATKEGEVSRIDEHDKPVSSDETLKESSEARTPVTPSAAATAQSSAAAPAPPSPVTTSGTRETPTSPARKHLPRTASDLPLLAVLSALGLAAGAGLRLARMAS